MPRSSGRGWWVALVLVYLSAVILVTNIDAMHLRADENLVFDQTRFDLRYIVNYLIQQDSHPLLWKSSFWFWRQLVGDSEFAGRLLAMFFSMLTLSLVYQIGRRWFGAARYGWFAVALLGVNTFFFIYSLEIRPYGLMMLLVTMSMWFFQRWVRRERWRDGVYYAVTLALMMYVHYFLLIAIMAQGIYFLAQRPSRRMWRQSLGVALIAFLLWLPWLPFALNQIPRVREAEVVGGNARGLAGMGATTMPTSLDAVMRLANLAFNGQLALYLVVFLIGLVYWWRQSNYRLALIWALGAPTISLLLNLVVAIFVPRYVDYMVVGLALALGAGLATLPRRVRWPALAAVALISLGSLRSELPADRIPFRDLFQQVSAAAGPDDVIFFDSGGLRDGFVQAQVRRYLAPDLWSRRVADLDAALEHRRVWYVTNGEWFRESTRQRFARLEQSHPLQQVIGRCDRDWCYLLQLMEGAPNEAPALFDDAMEFRGIDITGITEDAIAARLWWTADSHIDLDYSIGLHLVDSAGALVAQIDGPIIDQYSGATVQTSQLEPGKLTIDVRQISLPSELPAGEYTLILIVYRSWDNVRLHLPDGSDHLVLQTIDVS